MKASQIAVDVQDDHVVAPLGKRGEEFFRPIRPLSCQPRLWGGGVGSHWTFCVSSFLCPPL